MPQYDIEKIRDAILQVVQGAESVGEAHRTDRSKFDNFPAAVVTPSEMQADYAQTSPATNRETYAFKVRLHFPFTEGQDKADIALEKALGELIVAFRDRTALGSAADWVAPAPGAWGYQDREGGIMRTAELTVTAIKYTG